MGGWRARSTHFIWAANSAKSGLPERLLGGMWMRLSSEFHTSPPPRKGELSDLAVSPVGDRPPSGFNMRCTKSDRTQRQIRRADTSPIAFNAMGPPINRSNQNRCLPDKKIRRGIPIHRNPLSGRMSGQISPNRYRIKFITGGSSVSSEY